MNPNSLPPKIVNDEVIFVRCAPNLPTQKLEMSEEILCVTKRQIRSIVDLCEEFSVCSKVQNLPLIYDFLFFNPCSDASLSIIAWAAS